MAELDAQSAANAARSSAAPGAYGSTPTEAVAGFVAPRCCCGGSVNLLFGTQESHPKKGKKEKNQLWSLKGMSLSRYYVPAHEPIILSYSSMHLFVCLSLSLSLSIYLSIILSACLSIYRHSYVCSLIVTIFMLAQKQPIVRHGLCQTHQNDHPGNAIHNGTALQTRYLPKHCACAANAVRCRKSRVSRTEALKTMCLQVIQHGCFCHLRA